MYNSPATQLHFKCILFEGWVSDRASWLPNALNWHLFQVWAHFKASPAKQSCIWNASYFWEYQIGLSLARLKLKAGFVFISVLSRSLTWHHVQSLGCYFCVKNAILYFKKTTFQHHCAPFILEQMPNKIDFYARWTQRSNITPYPWGHSTNVLHSFHSSLKPCIKL